MSLTGKQIKDTYKNLLIVDNNNAGVDGTTRPVIDGEGTTSALSLSQTEATVTGNLTASGTITQGTEVVATQEWVTTNATPDLTPYLNKNATEQQDVTPITHFETARAKNIGFLNSAGQVVAGFFTNTTDEKTILQATNPNYSLEFQIYGKKDGTQAAAEYTFIKGNSDHSTSFGKDDKISIDTNGNLTCGDLGVTSTGELQRNGNKVMSTANFSFDAATGVLSIDTTA